MNNTVLIKHNMLISSYLFYQSGPMEEERNAVDLTFCSGERVDVSSRAVCNVTLQNVQRCVSSSAVSNLALQNALMCPAEQ